MNDTKILVVDDIAHLRFLVRKFLEKSGFSVIEAGDGEEALRAIQLNPEIKLVFLDLMMPKMNGLEFLSRMSSLKAEFEIKICAMTAKETTEDIKECLRKGADDYIVKPVDEMILVDKAKILLGDKEVNDFSMMKLDVEGFIEMPEDQIPIKIENISESSITFTSSMLLPVGARIFVNSPWIQKVMGNKKSLLLRIYRVEKKGALFTNIGTFVALKDDEYKLIRSVTTKGG